MRWPATTSRPTRRRLKAPSETRLPPRRVLALRAAAERAAQLGANDQAVVYFRQALAG